MYFFIILIKDNLKHVVEKRVFFSCLCYMRTWLYVRVFIHFDRLCTLYHILSECTNWFGLLPIISCPIISESICWNLNIALDKVFCNAWLEFEDTTIFQQFVFAKLKKFIVSDWYRNCADSLTNLVAYPLRSLYYSHPEIIIWLFTELRFIRWVFLYFLSREGLEFPKALVNGFCNKKAWVTFLLIDFIWRPITLAFYRCELLTV